MLTINDDFSIKLDEKITPEQIVEILLSLYSGEFSRCLASQLNDKCIHFKNNIKETYIQIVKMRFEQELCDLFINLNKPFFNNLDIQMEVPEPPFISPLDAFSQAAK